MKKLTAAAIRRDLEYCANFFEEFGQPVPSLSFTDFTDDAELLRCYAPLVPQLTLAELRTINTARGHVLHRHGIATAPVLLRATAVEQWRLLQDRQPSATTVEDYLRTLPAPKPPARPLTPLIPGFCIGTAEPDIGEEDAGWVISRSPLVIAKCEYEGDFAIRFEIWDTERYVALREKRQAKIARAMLHAWQQEFAADISDYAADRPRGWIDVPSMLLESTPSRFTGWLRGESPLAIFTALEHRAGFTNVVWLDQPFDLGPAVIAEELEKYSIFLASDSELPPPDGI